MEKTTRWVDRTAWATGLAACLCLCRMAGAEDPAAWMTLWGEPELESGRVDVRRDATGFAAGSAAMVIDTGTQPAKGSLTRGLLVQAGTSFTVSAKMKLEAGIQSASLVVNLIGAEGGSHPILVPNKAGDWVAARKSVTVPQGIGMAFLHLSFEGKGKLWIDELKIEGALDTGATGKLNAFGMPFGYAFGSFTGHASVADGAAHLDAEDCRGGAGYVYHADLSQFAGQCPVLSLKQGPKNRAERLRLNLQDARGNERSFEYDLTKASAARFTDLMPVDGWAVSPAAADEPDQSFDAGRVKGHLLIGDWGAARLDVHVREIAFAEPTAELLEKRRAKVEQVIKKAAQERERQRREAEARERMLEDGADHPEDGPEVQAVAAVAPNVLAVTIQERWRAPGKQVPYQPQPGDEVRADQGAPPRLAWDHGKPALVATRSVWRQQEGQNRPERLGILVDNGRTLTIESTIHGTPITRETLEEPRAYRVRLAAASGAGGDVGSKRSWRPTAVFRKSKPLERAGNGQAPIRHVIYLKLPEPLEEGAGYAVEMHGINTRQAEVAYTHEPRKNRSEAVHVTQIGYRPTDPFKRAYLSVWLGTGGKHSFDVDGFELLDANSGQSVYRGQVRLGVAAEQAEMLRPEKNHNRTDVYWLDFSDFGTPGTYRVFVPGVGVSYPFEIADDVWLDAFRTSMHGLLCHRSGIELGPPFSDYRRPRPFHPDDGMKIYGLDVTMLDGESDAVDKAFRRLLGPRLEASALERHAQAWGGYMDAGDWDRRSLHLRVSYLQLELFQMFPAFFEKTKLALPPNEANNRLPDLVDEALWNLEFYRRLQDADGGVGGGVESTAHPMPGEASWQESQLVGAFAPDPVSSYRYAASGAKLAGVVRPYDPELAAAYRSSAERAWHWAEKNSERVIEEVRGRGGKVKPTAGQTVAEPRALAAVELYRLTGEDSYHAAFRESSPLGAGGDPGEQLDATFAYANLPAGLGDAKLRQRALEWLESQGEQVIRMSQRNAFNIGCRVPQLPMMGFVGYFTTPETAIGPVLPRLDYLTGDAKYLRGAVAVTQYGAGANPVNAAMTTGLGHDYPRAPLHVDSLHTGRVPPRGITIYGPHDPTRAPGWVKTWVLGKNTVPPADEWPASEFHVDVSGWPEMSEYTVHQSIGPTGYYWGYLAARAAEVER